MPRPRPPFRCCWLNDRDPAKGRRAKAGGRLSGVGAYPVAGVPYPVSGFTPPSLCEQPLVLDLQASPSDPTENSGAKAL